MPNVIFTIPNPKKGMTILQTDMTYVIIEIDGGAVKRICPGGAVIKGPMDPLIAEAIGDLLTPLAVFVNQHTGEKGSVFTVTKV